MKDLLPHWIIWTFLTAVVLFAAGLGVAQTERVEASVTTTTSTGTISEFGSQGIAIKTPAGTQPVRFMSNDTTNYVDEEGNPIPFGSVQAGLPVTIYYTKVGDTLIASKVVVRQSGDVPSAEATVVVPPTRATTPATVTEQTTATITTGTVAELVPGGIVVRSGAATEPIRYLYSERTTYVDEAGAPVAIEAVRAGVPVTVQYERAGNVLLASRVVVRTSAPPAPAQPTTIAIPGKVVAPGAEIEVETKTQTITPER